MALSMFEGQKASDYTFKNNTYYGPGKFMLNGKWATWQAWRQAGLDADSKFVSGTPATKPWIRIRPNPYTKGRANIVIYNWAKAGTVPVDVSSILAAGDEYELRDAQNFFGKPALSGKYDGGTLAVPMKLTEVAKAVGNVPTPPVHTGPEFGAFILMKKERRKVTHGRHASK